MSQQAQAVVQAQQKTSKISPSRSDFLQRAAVISSLTPVHQGTLQRCSGGVECAECRQKREGTMQRAAVSPAPVNAVPPIVHDVLSSSGQPLDAGTRAFVEPRFGHDFSGVRVHTDSRAAESARAVNALAYTVGRDVVFGSGQYEPGTSEGRRLLAHELTHVVQQNQFNGLLQPVVNAISDVGEEEAERVAHDITQDNPAMMVRKSHLQESGTLFYPISHITMDVRLQGSIQRQTMNRGPGCDDLLAEIIARVVEMKERAQALIDNSLNLPPTGPMSIDGHQQQFRNKQVNLRNMLNKWNTDNCGPGLPSDAWQWATRPVPSPAPSAPSSPRTAEPIRDGSKIRGEDVAKAAGATVLTVGGGYILYRAIRFLPSLLPPLWWTIPANAAIP